MKTVHFISDIFKKFPWMLINSTLLMLGAGILGAFSLLSLGPLVDFLIHPDLKGLSPVTQKAVDFLTAFGIPVSLQSWLLILTVFVALTSVVQVLMRHQILRTKYAVLKDLIVGTLGDIFNARWHFFSSSRQGTLLNTFTSELEVIGNAFGAMALLLSVVLQLIFFLGVPLYISWQVTLISLGAALLFITPFALLGKLSYRYGVFRIATANDFMSVVHESFNLAKIFLGFGHQRKGVDKLDNTFKAHIKVAVISQTLSLAMPILYRPFAILVIGIALFASKWFLVPFSEMTILLIGLTQVGTSIGNITMYKNSLENFFPSYEQIKSLRQKAREFKQISGSKIFNGLKEKITIRGLSFAHPDGPLTLKNVNMVIPKGQMVAVVGKSGAGKSTLIDLLMGFHQPLEGGITVDGVPVEEFDIISYRQRVGYVPQESALFNMSIRDNLLWANDKASEKDIQEASALAYADEFILQLPKQYDTVVGDRGVRLSGGQVQRIALARALLRKPDLLILDEATSSLDSYSERLIQKAVENISQETTVVIIAHRLSTIKNADYIYVFHGGEIIEEGTFDQLLAKRGQFQSMLQLQELAVSATA